jgi:hypothetical protein
MTRAAGRSPGASSPSAGEEPKGRLARALLRARGRLRWFLGIPALALALVLIASPLVMFWRATSKDDSARARDWSETLKNVSGSAAVLGAALAAIGWMYERLDRATDILSRLDDEFRKPASRRGSGSSRNTG